MGISPGMLFFWHAVEISSYDVVNMGVDPFIDAHLHRCNNHAELGGASPLCSITCSRAQGCVRVVILISGAVSFAHLWVMIDWHRLLLVTGCAEALPARLCRSGVLSPARCVHTHRGDCAGHELCHRAGLGLLLGHL